MTTYDFIVRNWPELMHLAWQHTVFVSIALAIAIVTGVPLGVYLTFNRRLADTVLYLAGIMMTVPSVALFGLMIPFLSVFGHGIGTVPAVIALVLYSQLPILRSTYAAIRSVDPAIIDAGLGIGMTRAQVLFKIQIPMSLGVIFRRCARGRRHVDRHRRDCGLHRRGRPGTVHLQRDHPDLRRHGQRRRRGRLGHGHSGRLSLRPIRTNAGQQGAAT